MIDVPTKRVVETSSGWLVVDVREVSPYGLLVDATSFDADGLETRSQGWVAKAKKPRPHETLDSFLVWLADLPQAEAQDLALRIEGEWLEDWRARGGPRDARHLDLAARGLLAGLVVLAALAVVGLGAIIGGLVWWLA